MLTLPTWAFSCCVSRVNRQRCLMARGPVSRLNIPKAPLRWSIERAGVEFALGSQTLRKGLAKQSIVCGADGCFSTAEICRAIFGGLSEERLATQRQITKKLELENAITTGSVLSRANVLARGRNLLLSDIRSASDSKDCWRHCSRILPHERSGHRVDRRKSHICFSRINQEAPGGLGQYSLPSVFRTQSRQCDVGTRLPR